MKSATGMEIMGKRTVRGRPAKMVPGFREAMRMIRGGMSSRARTVDFLLEELRHCVQRGELKNAGVIARAILVLFPKGKIAIADARFRGYWQFGKRREAVKVYHKVGRMFWHSESVGRHYERQGQIGKACREYEQLEKVFPGRGRDFLTMRAQRVLLKGCKRCL